MKTLTIAWQRLLDDGQTCPRCGSTETEIGKAVTLLTQSLAPLGIAVVLEKSALSNEQFACAPLQSNAIRIDGKLLEEWVGGETGQSPCCDVCGSNDCRTTTVGDDIYEVIPSDLIVKAGLLAAAQLLGREECDFYPATRPGGGCCPK